MISCSGQHPITSPSRAGSHGQLMHGLMHVLITMSSCEQRPAHLHVVHAVEVVAGEDDNVLHVPVLDVLKHPAVLAHCGRGREAGRAGGQGRDLP